jgi:hypothetical protein
MRWVGSEIFLGPGVPWPLLGRLRDYQGLVEDLGLAEVDGETLREYRVVIDIEPIQALQNGVISDNTISATARVWLGPEGLIRRFSTTRTIIRTM